MAETLRPDIRRLKDELSDGYIEARMALLKFLKRAHSTSATVEKISTVIKRVTEEQKRTLSTTLPPAFLAGTEVGKKYSATIQGSISAVGFDRSQVSTAHLNKIADSAVGSLGRYNNALATGLKTQYELLISDNEMVYVLTESGWSKQLERALIKRGISAKGITLLKGQSTTKKMVAILERFGIRGGMHPRDVATLLGPVVRDFFGPHGVAINNVGKKVRTLITKPTPGKWKWVQKKIVRPFTATTKTYSRMVAHNAILNAYGAGRYDTLEATKLVDHYISVSVLDATTCTRCAMMHGQRVTHAEGPLYHSFGACTLEPVWGKSSGLKNRESSYYDNARDKHLVRMNDLKTYNKQRGDVPRLKFFSELPVDAITTEVPTGNAMAKIREIIVK